MLLAWLCGGLRDGEREHMRRGFLGLVEGGEGVNCLFGWIGARLRNGARPLQTRDRGASHFFTIFGVFFCLLVFFSVGGERIRGASVTGWLPGWFSGRTRTTQGEDIVACVSDWQCQ